MRTRGPRPLFLTAVLIVTASACILDPGDGEAIVPNGSSPNVDVAFRGYTWQKDAIVELEQWRNVCYTIIGAPANCRREWSPIGTARSSSSPSTLLGLTGYFWQGTFSVVGLNSCGIQAQAKIRARANGSLLTTVVPDWYGCWQDHPNWSGFLANCIGISSPEVWLFNPQDPEPCQTPPGLTGDVWTSSCMHEPGTTCGQPGYPSGCGPDNVAKPVLVPKVWKCRSGNDVCEFLPRGAEGSYCQVANEGACGGSSGTICHSNSDCFPGSRCVLQYYDVARCQPTDQCRNTVPACWALSDKANLCAFD